VSAPTGWNGSLTLNSSNLLRVTVTYPTQVRSTYPDVIANSADGEFNAGFVRIYVRPTGGGSVLQFEGTITPGVASQQFTVGGSAGTNIGSGALPTRASADLCPYEPGNSSYTSTTLAGSSTFSSGTYEVAIAFRYANTITSINHADTDCIPEASLTFSQIYDAAKYYGAAVSTYSDLAALSASSVYDLQLRPVIDTHEIYNYRAATTTWESLVTPSVATVAALRLIPAPIAANKKYFVEELKKYTRYDTSLTGAETGNGIFKPYNLADNVAGRHVIEEVV
jgi:hypothetical protein